jgi:hypothetical protein
MGEPGIAARLTAFAVLIGCFCSGGDFSDGHGK